MIATYVCSLSVFKFFRHGERLEKKSISGFYQILVAFVGLFSSVSFQMSSQIAGLNRCIVALLANCMSEQMLNLIGCICTTFLQCEFSNVFSNRLSEEMRSRIG